MATHAGIFGPTSCGKTHLAKRFCVQYKKQGIESLVLDPFDDDWTPAVFKTTNIEKFIAMAKRSRNCALFVDEAGQLDLRNPDHEWLVTGSRHWGHICHIIGQSGTQISPLVRSCLKRLFLFRSGKDTCKFWADTFVQGDIHRASQLAQYEFLWVEAFKPVKVCKLDR